MSDCSTARFAGKSAALANKRNAAADAQELPNVKIILTKGPDCADTKCWTARESALW